MKKLQNLYDLVIKNGVEYDTHESDLYIKDAPENWMLIANSEQSEFMSNITMFRNQIDKQIWLDIPFANTKFWERKIKGGIK